MQRALPIALVLLAGLLAAVLWHSYGTTRPNVRTNVPQASTPTAGTESSSARELDASTEAAHGGVIQERTKVETAPRPIVLAGIVLDLPSGEGDRGTPASGVEVRGYFLDDDLEPVVTDDRGRFRIELPDPGERPLRFRLGCDGREGLREARSEIILNSSEHESLGIELRRHPHGALEGVTVDLQGAPVPDVELVFSIKGKTHTTTSDSEGRFRLENAEGFDGVAAERDGYQLLDAPRPEQIPTGGWEPMRVVLAQVGRLRVLVTDERGEPLSGYDVSVSLSKLERLGNQHRAHAWLPVRAETGSNGIAVCENVWAGHRLTIDVGPPAPSWEGKTWLESERAHAGSLIFAGQAVGSPITVEPGEQIDLRAMVQVRRQLRGRVEDEGGQPIAQALLLLVGVDRFAVRELETATGPDGRFTLEVVSARPLGSARLYAAVLDKPPNRADFVDLDLSAAAPEEIVLVLRQPLAIHGRLIDRNRKGVKGWVDAFPSGDRQEKYRYLDESAFADEDGKFSVYVLAPGNYDLRARPRERYAETWLRGVETGRDGVEILVERELPVRVAIEVRLREGEPRWIDVLNARLLPHAGNMDAPRLDEVTDWRGLGGWPGAVGLRDGMGRRADERGMVEFTSESILRENLTTLHLEEGLYWLGAKGKDEEERTLFPVGTGLVRLDAGEYRLRFELVTAVAVEGRVHASEVLDLAIGVAHEGKELLELFVDGPPLERYRELGADGYFTFEVVPVGNHELWVGTPAELEAGSPVHRQRLSVERNGVPFLDVLFAR